MDINIIAFVVGMLGVLAAFIQAWYTRIGVRKDVIVEIRRELDAPEDKSLLNQRIARVRYDLRQEFRPGIADLERQMREILTLPQYIHILDQISMRQQESEATAHEMKAIGDEIKAMYERIMAEHGRYASDIQSQQHTIEAIQQQIEDMMRQSSNKELSRQVIRRIAEQLFQIASVQS